MPTTREVILLIEKSRAYGRGLLRGIARYVGIHGPWLFQMRPEFYREDTGGALWWTKKRDADGVIAHVGDSRTIEIITNLGIPAVIAGIREPVARAHAVITDDVAIGQMAADHFLARGFRRFAYCGFDEMLWSRRRRDSFIRVATESGCDVCVYEQPKKRVRTEEGERLLIADWLRSLPRPIALLACNDDRGKQVLAACDVAGLDVPDDVAILGVDNDDLICGLGFPQLSSIALNTEAAGYEAASALDGLMSGREPSEPSKQIRVSPLYVIERHSTDVVAMEDREVAVALRYIREHAAEVIQVGDVAEAIMLSRRALQQRFRRVLGRSVHEEIKRARVDRMARMLVTTNLSIAEIARLLRCTDVNNISRYFRQRMGLTPTQYRRKHRLP